MKSFVLCILVLAVVQVHNVEAASQLWQWFKGAFVKDQPIVQVQSSARDKARFTAIHQEIPNFVLNRVAVSENDDQDVDQVTLSSMLKSQQLQRSLLQLQPLSQQQVMIQIMVYVRSIMSEQSLLGSFRIVNAYRTKHNGITHVYLKQTVQLDNETPMDIVNGDMGIHVDSYGHLVTVSHSFASESTDTVPQAKTSTLSVTDAFISLSQHLKMSLDSDALIEMIEIDPPVKQRRSRTRQQQQKMFHLSTASLKNPAKAYRAVIQQRDEETGEIILHPVWQMSIDMEHTWPQASVSTIDGTVLALSDWVSDASYRALPLGVNDPSDGEFALDVNPAALAPEASPFGWHSFGHSADLTKNKTSTFTDTRGNNVFAQENLDGGDNWEHNKRPNGGALLVFDFPWHSNKAPVSSLDAAVTHLFYICNIIHDVFYVHGFDEEAGNFQEHNFGRGGLGEDAVQANAQDGSGVNNANFATPPDGERPRMRMYTWDKTTPHRDGDLETGIIVHEYAHGISTRLTGGPANSDCLNSGEGAGMGEGWGDTFATMFRQRAEYTRDHSFTMGSYSFGDAAGIRKYPYSTSKTVNPSTYAYIRKLPYLLSPHARGEVWAEILYEVYWNMVDTHGFDPDWYAVDGGNTMFLRLLVDGMKLQPCRPTFVSARDAILAAEEVSYGGENKCLLWQAFSKRGLGVKAKAGGKEDFSLPIECTVQQIPIPTLTL